MAIPFLGKLLDTVVGKGADLISEYITDKDEAARLEHAFRIAMLEDGALERQVEADMFKAQQETIQAELHQTDLYTKQTRPKVARQSWYVTALYAVSGMLIPALPANLGLQVPDIQWEIFLVLASPSLTYMGVRGFEKFKAGGSK